MKKLIKISRVSVYTLILTLIVLAVAPVMGKEKDEPESMEAFYQKFLQQQVEEFTLENGMKFLFIHQPSVPIFSATIMVKAGSVDEPSGKTGVAHVFEHMAFKGSTTVGTSDYAMEAPILEEIENLGQNLTDAKRNDPDNTELIESLSLALTEAQVRHSQFIVDNEFSKIYNENGSGFLNAGTGRDVTMYMVNLPNNRLELWARMEVDRLLNPVFRQFYKERDVIQEERRMSRDNNPMGALWGEFSATAFNAHPYGDPIIGWEDDLINLTIRDARAFHNRYYVPGNIVVAVAGDLELSELKAVAEKYFGALPAKPVPERTITAEPLQKSNRIVSLTRDAEPMILMGWHGPLYPDSDSCALSVAASILGDGATSRLYQRLVMKENLATDVSASFSDLARYPDMFTISVHPKEDADRDAISRVINTEIEKLANQGPSPAEMEKIQRKMIADFLRNMESNLHLAMQLGYFQTVLGDWRIMGKYLIDLEKVTSDDVMRSLNDYIVSGQSTTAVLIREKLEEGE